MNKLILLILSTCCIPACLFAQPINPAEPVKYIGTDGTSNSDYKTGYHDGQMQPAIGVQNYQIMRANRTHPEKSDGLGWTYNHAPNLAYWNNKFYCQYLANPVGEHIVPGATLLTTSPNGKNWDKPQIIFPIYFTADSNASVEYHFMHQRMGFYVAPNGRLLTMGFYGDPYGNGIGRVVREIYKNNELGPVFFIKMNKTWKGEIKYPTYTESADTGFVEACNAFLADKVRRMQWCEENRNTENAEDFFRVPLIDDGNEKKPGQAFCFYTLPDSTLIGFFKSRWVTTSTDNGNTWSQPVQCNTLTYGGAKIWGQRMDNGQYALVYNPTNSMARHPLSIATSNDGINYNHLLNVHCEVPVKRYWGAQKRPGPQYVRGIIEGNGNPPGNDIWVVYSESKEDMWVARIPVPVKGEVNGQVDDNFNEMELGGVVKNWNIYSPRWCPVEISTSPNTPENVLMLKDFDPYDYAKAVRVFQKSEKVNIKFDLFVESNAEILAIEIVAGNGARCIQTQLDKKGVFRAKNGEKALTATTSAVLGKWVPVEFGIDTDKNKYYVRLNGKKIVENYKFATNGQPERIVFRTGKYRLTDDVQKYKSGDKSTPGWDEPGADEPVAPAVFYIRNFNVKNN